MYTACTAQAQTDRAASGLEIQRAVYASPHGQSFDGFRRAAAARIGRDSGRLELPSRREGDSRDAPVSIAQAEA